MAVNRRGFVKGGALATGAFFINSKFNHLSVVDEPASPFTTPWVQPLPFAPYKIPLPSFAPLDPLPDFANFQRYDEFPAVDDADAVEPRQQPDDLGRGQRVSADDIVKAHQVQHRDGGKKQPGVVDDFAFLPFGELGQQVLLTVEVARQLGELDAGSRADRIDAFEREVTGREHALDAGFAHADALRNDGIGKVARLQFALQHFDDGTGLGHDGLPLESIAAVCVFRPRRGGCAHAGSACRYRGYRQPMVDAQ
jgi:hypothetical protein